MLLQDPNGGVRYIYFDFNEQCKGGSKMDSLDSLCQKMYDGEELAMYVKILTTGKRAGEKVNKEAQQLQVKLIIQL